MSKSVPISMIALALASPDAAVAAGSQPVAYLSLSGANGPSCTREAPCRTLQHALNNVVAPGGSIYLLSSGNFGLATISFSVSIIGTSSAPSGVNAFSPGATGLTIAASATDKIVLQGLTIDGGTVAAKGVSVRSAQSVLIKECVIRNVSTGPGLEVRAATPMTVTVEDTMFLNNGVESAHLEAIGANTLTAAVTRVQMVGAEATETGNVKADYKDSFLGVKISGGASGAFDNSYVTVENNGIAFFSKSNVRITGAGQNRSFGDNVVEAGSLTSATRAAYK